MRATFGKLRDDPTVKAAIMGWEKTLQFEATDIEAYWYIETYGGELTFHEGRAESPDITLSGTGENLEGLIAGTLQPMTALMSGAIRVSGAMTELMRLSSIMEPLKNAYMEAKREFGGT